MMYDLGVKDDKIRLHAEIEQLRQEYDEAISWRDWGSCDILFMKILILERKLKEITTGVNR